MYCIWKVFKGKAEPILSSFNSRMWKYFQEGGPIALVENGDMITIDIRKRRMDVNLTDEEMAERRKKWTPPPPKADKGVLYKVM